MYRYSSTANMIVLNAEYYIMTSIFSSSISMTLWYTSVYSVQAYPSVFMYFSQSELYSNVNTEQSVFILDYSIITKSGEWSQPFIMNNVQ